MNLKHNNINKTMLSIRRHLDKISQHIGMSISDVICLVRKENNG